MPYVACSEFLNETITIAPALYFFRFRNFLSDRGENDNWSLDFYCLKNQFRTQS